MADLEIQLTCNTALNRLGRPFALMVWPLWAIFAPFALLVVILAVSISALSLSPDITRIVLFTVPILVLCGLSLTAAVEDNRIVLNKRGLLLTRSLGKGLKRILPWSDFVRVDVDRSKSTPSIKLVTRGYTCKFSEKDISAGDLEQLMLGLEAWADPAVLTEDFKLFQREVQNRNRGIGQDSFTRMWEDELACRFSQTSFVPLQPGRLLCSGKLAILRQLAFGGFAAVYLAHGPAGTVVLKEAAVPAGISDAERAAADDRFAREAQILMRLEHPQIARIYDHFVEDGRQYLVLEYIHGTTLKQSVKQAGPVDEARARDWLKQLLSVLSYLHRQEPPVVHRDISPENIIVRSDGTLCLIDFGAANTYVEQLTGTMIGKQSYMSPEHLRGKASPASDLYSLGATLSFALTGKDPLPISVCHPRDDEAIISAEFDSLIAALTSMDPADRLAAVAGGV